MSQAPVVCITGGTRGLGLAMVRQFIRQGSTIATCGRNEQAINELATEFEGPHIFARVNVTTETDVDAFANRVIDQVGPPDFLINNAGIINRNAPLWEVPAEEFSTLIDVNIKGVANMIRSFTPAMIQRGSGVFVNFSSGWGRSTSPEVAPYCASKFAIEGLSQAFAQELPKGLASVALNPGIINTDMLQSCFGEGAEHYPTASEWANKAVPFILGLGPSENGTSLNAP